MKLRLLYRTTSFIAFMLIIVFMFSSLTSEFLGDHIIIANVKKFIFFSLPLVAICMITTVISIRKLILLYPNIPYKQLLVKRVKYIGIFGALFLWPLATILCYLAQKNEINLRFYLLQCVEIFFGSMNIFLFIKMFSDDKKLDN